MPMEARHPTALLGIEVRSLSNIEKPIYTNQLTGAALLIADIADTRDMLSGLSLSKTVPVGTSDAGSYFNTKVLEAVDYGVSARSSLMLDSY